MRHCALPQPRHLAIQVSKTAANNEICTRLRHKTGAGSALYSRARRSAWPRAAKRPLLVAMSDRAAVDGTAYSVAGWLTCGSSCGSWASSALIGCWTTHPAEWPPPSISVRQTCAHRSRNELRPICRVADNLARRAWLSTIGINERATRHFQLPGTALRLDWAFQGAIVSDGGPNVAHGCCQQHPSRCTRHRTCEDGDCGSQHPLVLERYVAPKGMRHNPNPRPANDTLGAVYIRRTPRAFACTDNDSARKLRSTLLVHSLQLTGTRADEFQNRLCPPNLVREALEDSNGRRRRNEKSNAPAGEFEMMRNLFVTRSNPTLQRASR